MQNEIETKRQIFYAVINQLRCLKTQIGNALLTPLEKRELYRMMVIWVKSYMKEEEQQAFFKDLPLHEIERLDDKAIKELFPALERALKKHHIVWYLLGDTQFLLEEVAIELNKMLIASEADPSAIQTALQQERETFSKTCLIFIQNIVDKMDQANQSFWIRSYVETLERHFIAWRESDILSPTSFLVDLKHRNLRGLDLRGIRLSQADLSRSTLAGCKLGATGVSAEQLATTEEFSQAIGVPEDLVLQAQIIQFKNWQARLSKRCEVFSELKQEIDKFIFPSDDSMGQDLDSFSLALNKCQKLTDYKRLLDQHIAAQSFEERLLNDLTLEQRKAIDQFLVESRDQESSFKSKLDLAVNQARWDLFKAYFEKIEILLAQNDLSKALDEMPPLLLLRTHEKDDYPFPQELDERLQAIKLQIIEQQIKTGDLEAARDSMRDIIADARKQKYTLDLRGKAIFEDKEFWKGLSIENVSLYLDPKQIQNLSTSQKQQYNVALFRTIETGDLEQVKYGIEHLNWDPAIRDEMGHTPIIRACWCGYEEVARYLHGVGGEVVKIERSGEKSINPLTGLVGMKYPEDPARYKSIIEWLIAEGLEIEPKDALLLNDAKIFKKSLDALPLGEAKKEAMRELLISAIENGADALVLWMLENQKECVNSFPFNGRKGGFFTLFSDITAQSTQELSLLHRACKKGRFKIVNLLLQYYLDEAKKGNISKQALKSNIQAALDYLAECFWKDYPPFGSDFSQFKVLYDNWKCIAELLCAEGAKHTLYTSLALNEDLEKIAPYITPETINKPCDAQKNTPLHLAVKTDNKRLVQYLIGKGANLDCINAKQDTALHLACERGNFSIAKYLLESKASPDGPRRNLSADEKEYLTKLADTLPEMTLFLHKKPLLLMKKKTLDGKEKEVLKERPVHVALMKRNAAIVEFLCQHGADLEEIYDGKTALHFAVQKEDKASVAILLRYGAKLSALNKDGNTPLEVAAAIGNIEIMRMLVLAPLMGPLSKMQNDEKRKEFFDSLGQWALESSENVETESAEVIAMPIIPTMSFSASSSVASSSLSSLSLTLFSPELIPQLEGFLAEEKDEKDEYDKIRSGLVVIWDGEAEEDDSSCHIPPQPQEPISDAILEGKEEEKQPRQLRKS